jgi:hypothetical protein
MKKFLLCITSFFLFLFFLPYLGETERGKQWICQLLFEKDGWKGSLKTVSFQWNASQTFSGLILTNGSLEIQVKDGKIHRSLLELLQDPFSPIPISLESGIIKEVNYSFFQDVLSLLRLRSSKEVFTFTKEPAIVEFDKMHVSFYKGIYTYPRTDFIVAGKFPFASWGSIDRKNCTLDIEIGPTAAFLQSTLCLQNIPGDFVLPFKIAGPLGHSHVYTEKALETLGLLILQQKILGSNIRPE